MTEKQLKLDFGLPGLNEILKTAKIPTRQHGKLVPGMAYARMKKKYTGLVADELLVQDCIPDPPYEKMHIYFSWTETAQHCRDPDNIRVGAKFVLDAMVQVGMIEDDTMEHIRLLRDSFLIGESRKVEVSWNKITNTTERRQI